MIIINWSCVRIPYSQVIIKLIVSVISKIVVSAIILIVSIEWMIRFIKLSGEVGPHII